MRESPFSGAFAFRGPPARYMLIQMEPESRKNDTSRIAAEAEKKADGKID
jgi:hypothetical protein